MSNVHFSDTQLQACFESHLADVDAVDAGEELRQVRALLATHAWFRVLEGAHSQRVHDTIDLLLSREFRPGLHRWYKRPGGNLDPDAITLRDHLSQLAGEKLGA